MDKQPFHHRAIVLFTATRSFNESDFGLLLSYKLQDRDIVPGTVICEEIEDDPGDPSDLV